MGTKNIASLKSAYLSFYADCPIQKYAAEYIGKDEDTVIRWKNNDQAFADAAKRLKSEYIRKRWLSTKAEFALERLDNTLFGPKAFLAVEQKQEVTFNQQLSDDFTEWLKERTKSET